MKKPDFVANIKKPKFVENIKAPKFVQNMKKPTWDQKLVLTVAGAAVIASSVITIVDYVERKRRDKASHVTELLIGMAGVAIGAALASEPRRQDDRKKLIVENMFDDEDIALANAQIRETLNNGVDRGEPVAAPKRTVEVDEDTSIEDFIF